MTGDREAIRFRDRLLVLGILGYVYEEPDPVRWDELVTVFGLDGGKKIKTVENALYELVAFGALHRIGKPATKRSLDSRALKPTPLGRAWLERELLPLPGEHAPDALEEADRIGDELEHAPELDELLDDIALELGDPDGPIDETRAP